MRPHIYIRLIGIKIHSFHFFGVLGYMLGTLLGVVLASQLNLKPLIVLLMAGIGAATFFLLAFLGKWITRQETIVYYHHEISILLLCTLYLYLIKQPILPYLDITLIGIGTFLAFGRIGCYSVGCCHGKPHKHGVKYGQQHVDTGFTWFYKDIPLLPVQLIESAYVFLTVLISVVLLLNGAIPGTVILVYTVVYGSMRYALEFLRGDPERPLWHGLSEAQWTTLALTSLTLVMSTINWLPFYSWHWIILLAMMIISLFTIYTSYRHPEYQLFSPPHIRQLAEGLDMLEKTNTHSERGTLVNIYTTQAGLNLSYGVIGTESNKQYFTFSLKNKQIMNKQMAHKMAQLIGLIKNLSGQFTLVEKQNGIYHLIFVKNRLVHQFHSQTL
ncbi:MAG: prolipoprotein diacylglyceryl transferase family protein [Saprospiraceae bacterium]